MKYKSKTNPDEFKEILPLEYTANFDNPRTWDNLGIMVCFHREYNLGDEAETHGFKSEDYNSWEELHKDIEKKGGIIIIPMQMLDHSGLYITAGNKGFSCDSSGWDSGQIGFIYTTAERIKDTYNCKKVTKKMLDKARKDLWNEIDIYAKYIEGDIWEIIHYKITKCKECKTIHKEMIEASSCIYGLDNAIQEIDENWIEIDED